ncbi:MAG: carboxypeptidase regulatory-like domain-containing protein [Deltaproteobacteria bacterium]|nr:carboxypeptidase regulatory-like domain-containing protein [Deltaproteobacteria bacterium]
MTGKTKTRFVRASLIATPSLLPILLACAGSAAAMYAKDGTVEISPGAYDNPHDGFCVSGITTAGTMAVVPGIGNFRDCVAYTTGLNAMVATDVTSRSTCPTGGTSPYTKACNVQANCTKLDGSLVWVAALQKCFDTSACTIQGATDGDASAHACAVPNDGAKHAYPANLCVDASTRAGISRLDLDNTAANCQEKGGVVSDGLFGHPYGACAAYGWTYGGVKPDGTLPMIGAKGVTSAEGLGFCYTTMRMTSVPYTVVTCPSQKNVSLVCAAGTNAGKTCTIATQAADCPSSTCVANSGWAAGTDGVLYQSQATYDAGLGWSFSSSQCLYAYGVKGYLSADLRGPDGAIAPAAALCAGGTGAASAGICVDLTGITTQGDCLAIGGTWDNWLVAGTGGAGDTTTQTVATSPQTSSIRKLDAITPIAAGGGKFYSGTGWNCTRCHTDQSRAYMERYKPGFVETGHKMAGVTPPWTTVGDAWGLQGVQCPICHATGKPPAQDLGVVIYPTKICVGGTAAGTACTTDTPCVGGGTCTAGVPRAASGHNQTEYGTHLTGVCFTCHGSAATPESVNPASAIAVSYGSLALTPKNLAPIANMFLNSPHAQYSGSSNKLDIITKTNYGSLFKSWVCRTGSEVTDAATTGNGVDVTALSTCGAGGTSSCNSVTNCPATPGGNRVWNPVTAKCYDKGVCAGAAGRVWDAGTSRCVVNQAMCEAQSDSGYGYIWSTTGTAGNPSIITTSGAGCYKAFASGSIVTTYWAGGAARRIPNVNSDTNTACTSTTEGAGAFWISDGEAAGSTGGVAFAATDGPNCMVCHDVHWSLDSADPEAEPFRRECDTCHEKNLAAMVHPKGSGTPLQEMDTDPFEACVTCHMPGREHLFRINTDATYSAFPAGALSGTAYMNTAADGSYANASWVDLDQACGQCHGGGTAQASTTGDTASGSRVVAVDSTAGFVVGGRVVVAGAGDAGADLDTYVASIAANDLTLAGTAASTVVGVTVKQNPTRNGAAYMTKAQLGVRAHGIHADAPVVSFGYMLGSPNTLTLNVDGSASSCSDEACDTYDWDWGDGTSHGSGVTASHTYATAGSKSVTLTVENLLVNEASLTKTVTVYAPDSAPTVAGTCSFDANTWTETVTDTSSDDHGVSQVTVNWGDGSVLANDKSTPFGPFSHAFTRTGAFTIVHKAIDTIGQQSSTTCTASPAYFSIGGTVKNKLGTANLASAVVTVKRSGVVVKTVYTSSAGTFSAGSLKPGSYTLTVTKSGYTFAVPAATLTTGPNSTGNTINAIAP